MILSLLFSVVGLKAAFDSHKIKGIPDVYSIHSWIGLVTVILFALQVSRFTRHLADIWQLKGWCLNG